MTVNPANIPIRASVSTLRLIPAAGAPLYPNIATAGYYTAGDGGGQQFYWNASDSRVDNGGTVINPTGNAGNGRWNAAFITTQSALTFGAKGDGVTSDDTALDNYAAWVLSENSSGRFWSFYLPTPPKGTSAYICTVSHTWTLSSIWMADNARLQFTATGINALTINDAGYFVGPTRFQVVGPGLSAAATNGVIWNNPVTTVDQIRVVGFNGYGLNIVGCFDSTINSISVQECGTIALPAFSMTAFMGNYCQETTINRLQVEACVGQVIYIDPNTFKCVINKIHSERAVATMGTFTWMLGGFDCTYNESRLEAITAANASVHYVGTGNTYINATVENVIPITVDGENNNSLTFITPDWGGPAAHGIGNAGLMTFTGGTVTQWGSLSSQPSSWFGSTLLTIITATSGSSPGRANTSLYGCTVVTQTVTAGYATLAQN